MDYGPVYSGNANPQMQLLQQQLNNMIKELGAVNNLPANGIKQPPSKAIEFVVGPNGAKEYLKNMGPNTSAAVFDSSEPVDGYSSFYVLSVDANGVPAPIKRGRYTLEDFVEPKPDILTKKDLDDFKSDILEMIRKAQQPQKQQNYQDQNRQNGRNDK